MENLQIASIAPNTHIGTMMEYLHSTQKSAIFDFSEASVYDVMKSYQSFKRKVHPGFKIDSQMASIYDLGSANGCVIMPSQITDVFYTLYCNHLMDKGCKYSTIQNYCTCIRAALKWATRYNCPVSDTYDMFEIPKYHKEMIALTPDEVSHIAHFDVSSIDRRPQLKERMERVRDMFVLSCNLGQRHSDMVRINKSNFERNKFKIIQQKTANKAVVDIDKMSFDKYVTYGILEKYNYEAPYKASIGNYNHSIHELLDIIGEEFHGKILQENKVGGLVVGVEERKCDIISSHTARRSFITNNVLRGFKEYEIRKASGHTDARSFNSYICIED